jgi:hypothetical protein
MFDARAGKLGVTAIPALWPHIAIGVARYKN